jgi:hypothetical protein
VKALELVLAVAATLCFLGSAAAVPAKRPALAAFLAATGGFLCSVWLLLRTA